MSSRYDSLQANEDPNDSAQLQEDQDARTASEDSTDSTQLHEDQNFRVASEGLIDSEQQQKDKDVQTSIVSAHEAEMPLGRPTTIVRRIGKLPCTLLFLTILGTAAFVIYSTFLWFNASGTKTWKDIALSGWMTRSIAVAAVVLRTSTTVQAGLASSMLAAVAIESTAGVSLQDLVPLSLMRASSAAPYALLAHPRLGCNGLNWLLLALAATISITTMSLQFTSTILLADLDAGFVPSDLAPYAYVLPTRRPYGSASGNWLRAPRPWPIFAEYTENNSADGSLGYSDTGFTMRALLPFSDTQNRSFIHAYEGPAPVVDARTICIRPNITNTRVVARTNYSSSMLIRGNISVPNDLLPILLAETPLRSFEPRTFVCEASDEFERDYWQQTAPESEWNVIVAWDLTLCNFGWPDDVFLTLPFRKDLYEMSEPFLLMNYTSYNYQRAQNRTKFPPLKLANFNDTTPGLHYHHRNEWLDLKQDAQALDWSNGNNFADTKLSFSLCLPVFKGWLLNITASSQAPLEEPMYSYDTERRQIRYDRVRKQLLRSSILPLEERNVLSLHSQSWLGSDSAEYQYPFGSRLTTLPGKREDQNLTLHLREDALGNAPRSDKYIAGLGLEILQEGGTPAEAMQSMLMSVLLADYQQYIFTEVPNGTQESTVVLRGEFITAQVPGGNGRPATNPAGPTRSYVLVMIVIAIHNIAVFVIFVLFIRGTKNTLLWESWHTIAQSISAVTDPYLSQANLATDSEIKRQMKIDGTFNQAVSIRTDDSGVRPELGVVRQRFKSTIVRKDSQTNLLMEELRSVRFVRDVER